MSDVLVQNVGQDGQNVGHVPMSVDFSFSLLILEKISQNHVFPCNLGEILLVYLPHKVAGSGLCRGRGVWLCGQ